jgi:bis(5'-nucleosyl)-tetraphosphatase (symmetrical)
MQTFAIGDIHGCYRTLEHLLRRLDLDETRDRLWLVGDLVNRGPASLEVLRWAKRTEEALVDRFVAVLGNHDLHLLAVDRGWAGLRRKDTLEELLASPDRGELVAWLAERPLLHRHREFILVHAGVLPQWTPTAAESWAHRVETGLRREDRAAELLRRANDGADVADPEWRALAAMTRMRALTARNEFCEYAGPPDETPVGCTPWFLRADRRTGHHTMVVGHWAAMGLRIEPGLTALDSGCAWGGPLSAIRLDDGVVFQQKNKDL